MDTLVVIEINVLSYEEASLLISLEFHSKIRSVLSIEKKSSAKVLSYGFPHADCVSSH